MGREIPRQDTMYTSNLNDADQQYFGVFEVTYRVTGKRGDDGEHTTLMRRQPDMGRPNDTHLRTNAHQVAAGDARHEFRARIGRQEDVEVVDIKRLDAESEQFFDALVADPTTNISW